MKPWHYIEIGLALLWVGSYVHLWRKYVRPALPFYRERARANAWQRAWEEEQEEFTRLRDLEEALRNLGWNGEPIHNWLAMRLFPLPAKAVYITRITELVESAMQRCGGTRFVTVAGHSGPDSGGQGSVPCPGCLDCVPDVKCCCPNSWDFGASYGEHSLVCRARAHGSESDRKAT